MITQCVCPHQNARPIGVNPSAVVIHDTGSWSAASTVSWFGNKLSRVSAHYLVGPEGDLYQFVDEDRMAWHAGASILEGVKEVNDYSIGIELTHAGDSLYPEAQLSALVALVGNICMTWQIPLRRVVGHRHICLPPGRKVDPCDAFDWMRFGLDVARWINTPVHIGALTSEAHGH